MNVDIESLKDDPIWKIIQNSPLDDIIANLPKYNTCLFDAYMETLFLLIEEHYEPTQKNILIAILLIHTYPDEFLSSKRCPEETILLDKVCEIYNLLILDNRNSTLLAKKIFTFSLMYSEWKKTDRDIQLNILAELYFRYSQDLREFLKISTDMNMSRYYNKLFKEFLNKVLGQMCVLDSNWHKYLDNYRYKNIGFDERTRTLMYNKLNEVYWDELKVKYLSNKSSAIIDNIIRDYSNLLEQITTEIDSNYLIHHSNAPIHICIELIKINKSIGDQTPYPDNILTLEHVFVIFRQLFQYLEKVLLDK